MTQPQRLAHPFKRREPGPWASAKPSVLALILAASLAACGDGEEAGKTFAESPSVMATNEADRASLDLEVPLSATKTKRAAATGEANSDAEAGEPAVTDEQASADEQWTLCALEGGECVFDGGVRQVRYGAADSFVRRDMTSPVNCNNATFGDPIWGHVKTCMVLEVQSPPKATNAWSNPATWPNGKLPRRGDDVVIASDRTVVLDTQVEVKSLTIEGTLRCTDERDVVGITADYIMVNGSQGLFECGTASKPMSQTLLRITMKGNTAMPMHPEMGARGFGVMHGGTLQLHGMPRTSWTKLAANAQAGDRSVTLTDTPLGWPKGASFVVGASSDDFSQAEVREVTEVEGNRVYFEEPLKHAHSGTQQTYPTRGTARFTADTRAPVGLLKHSIVFRGAGVGRAAETTGTARVGAHMMVMRGSKGFVSHVTFENVGNEGGLGQYPFHWHRVGDASGQYIKNSAIKNSLNRCVTVHGTDNALVEGNVCFEHLGHGYFLEDGNEQGNVFSNNLGMSAFKPHTALAILPSDHEGSPASVGPANFWISNPQNTFVNNMASGGQGTGFWYLLADNPKGVQRDGKDINPRTVDFGKFADNTASSTVMGYSSCPGGGTAGMESNNDIRIENFTAFLTTRSAVWPCGHKPQTFTRLMVLDSGGWGDKSNYVSPTEMLVKDSLFVANSGLTAFNGGLRKSRAAIGHYDQGTEFRDVHFDGFWDYAETQQVTNKATGTTSTVKVGSALVSHIGGAVKNYSTRISGATFEPKAFAAYTTPPGNGDLPQMASVIFDIDGSLSDGLKGWQLRPDTPLLTDGTSCQKPGSIQSGSHGVACNNRLIKVTAWYVELVAQKRNPADPNEVPTTTAYEIFKKDSKYVGGDKLATQVFTRSDTNMNYYQTTTIPNQGYHYGIKFATPPACSPCNSTNSMRDNNGNGLPGRNHEKEKSSGQWVLIINQAWAGDVIRFELEGVDPRTMLAQPSWPEAKTAEQFLTAPMPVWYIDKGTLHLRYKVSDKTAEWKSQDVLWFYLR